MTNTSPKDRNEVLDAFMLEQEHGKDTLERYLRAYPQHAAPLVDLSRELTRDDESHDLPLTPAEQSRIDAAWIAHKAAKPATEADPLTAMTAQMSKVIAQCLGVPRQVVSCFRDRKVEPVSVPRRILALFAEKIEIPLLQFEDLLAQSPALKSAKSYKADGKPGNATKATFEQILIDAGVTQEDRNRLLADEI
jgi:hypothetical protein